MASAESAHASEEILNAMWRVQGFVEDLKIGPLTAGEREQIFAGIREFLAYAPFFDGVTLALVANTQILWTFHEMCVNERGLFPPDVCDDSFVLLQKWTRDDLEPSVLRGIAQHQTISATTGRRNTSYSIERTWAFKVPCDEESVCRVGNGQWWPYQICMLRDGAHGQLVAGIHGTTETGALSVVLGGGDYQNEDHGTTVLFCGTKGKPGSPSRPTQLLLKNVESGIAVLLFRSSSLPKENPYRPVVGIRADGFYTVVSFEIVDNETAMHKFKLVRVAGQTPIRSTGKYAKPSLNEVAIWEDMYGRESMMNEDEGQGRAGVWDQFFFEPTSDD